MENTISAHKRSEKCYNPNIVQVEIQKLREYWEFRQTKPGLRERKKGRTRYKSGRQKSTFVQQQLKCETPLERYWLTATMSISISDQKHFNDLLFFFTKMAATMAATHCIRQRYLIATLNPMFAKRISKSTYKN